MIKGKTVILYNRTKTGEDDFHKPIYTETPVEVENVLIAPAQEQEVIDTLKLYGKKAVYTLGIPKKDTNVWEAEMTVEFYNEKWKVIGKPVKGQSELIPGKWNMKVRVESYE